MVPTPKLTKVSLQCLHTKKEHDGEIVFNTIRCSAKKRQEELLFIVVNTIRCREGLDKFHILPEIILNGLFSHSMCLRDFKTVKI